MKIVCRENFVFGNKSGTIIYENKVLLFYAFYNSVSIYLIWHKIFHSFCCNELGSSIIYFEINSFMLNRLSSELSLSVGRVDFQKGWWYFSLSDRNSPSRQWKAWSVLWRLIWCFSVCLCVHKKTLGLYSCGIHVTYFFYPRKQCKVRSHHVSQV